MYRKFFKQWGKSTYFYQIYLDIAAMKNYTILSPYLVVIAGFFAASCIFTTSQPEGRSDIFDNAPLKSTFPAGRIDEASGLAGSRAIKGYLWTHNDSGNPAELFLLSEDGKDLRSYGIGGIENRDWEDIAVGPGPNEGVSYVYIGDIGNNNANPSVTTYTLYRVPELKDLNAGFDANSVARISYKYPDGPHDAETLLSDPITKDIFIVSKELDGANLYRLPFPQSEAGVSTAELVGKVSTVTFATGGDIVADGKEIVVRNYGNIYYWKRKDGETVGQTLTRAPSKTLPYELEPQGEAVCFGTDMEGYYTLSERREGIAITLNYYKRK